MGVWGLGSFENDVALDWVCDLKEMEGVGPLREMFDAAAKMEVITEIYKPSSSELLVAAEVVAAFDGKPVADIPEELEEWLAKQGKLDVSTLKPLAIEIVKRVRDESEWCSCWEESNLLAEWQEQVDELLARLTS